MGKTPEKPILTAKQILKDAMAKSGLSNEECGRLLALDKRVERSDQILVKQREILGRNSKIEGHKRSIKYLKDEIEQLECEMIDVLLGIEQLDLFENSNRHAAYLDAVGDLSKKAKTIYALVFENNPETVLNLLAETKPVIVVEARDWCNHWKDVGDWPDARLRDLQNAVNAMPKPTSAKVEDISKGSKYTPPADIPKTWKGVSEWLDEKHNAVFQAIMSTAIETDKAVEALPHNEQLLIAHLLTAFPKPLAKELGKERLSTLVMATTIPFAQAAEC